MNIFIKYRIWNQKHVQRIILLNKIKMVHTTKNLGFIRNTNIPTTRKPSSIAMLQHNRTIIHPARCAHTYSQRIHQSQSSSTITKHMQAADREETQEEVENEKKKSQCCLIIEAPLRTQSIVTRYVNNNGDGARCSNLVKCIIFNNIDNGHLIINDGKQCQSRDVFITIRKPPCLRCKKKPMCLTVRYDCDTESNNTNLGICWMLSVIVSEAREITKWVLCGRWIYKQSSNRKGKYYIDRLWMNMNARISSDANGMHIGLLQISNRLRINCAKMLMLFMVISPCTMLMLMSVVYVLCAVCVVFFCLIAALLLLLLLWASSIEH